VIIKDFFIKLPPLPYEHKMIHILPFFQRLSPLSNAASWDNVGILIPSNIENNDKKYLLTIDFTPQVLRECIEKNIKKVISYHPVLFDAQRNVSLFTAAIIENRISVFSPHTALDNVMNRTLLSRLGCFDIETADYMAIGNNGKRMRDIIDLLKMTCNVKEIRLALSDIHRMDSIPPYIYASVGSGRFSGGENSIIITGEMSHHNIMKLKKFNTIMLVEHCRSERWFLNHLKVMMEDSIPDVEVIVSEYDVSPVSFV
ncbi:Ngg1-interacting factor 3 protein NIF3L1, partial [Trachipleistophora hominis]